MWGPSPVKKEPLDQPPFQETDPIGDGLAQSCKQETHIEEQSENLELPPSPPPLPSVSDSTVPESGCDNLNPLSPLLASALLVPTMPKSMVSESGHEKAPDVLLSETVPPTLTKEPEPPVKKLRTMHYTPDPSTEAHQLNVNTDPLVSGAAGATDTGLTRGDEMEAPLVDANKRGDKDSSDMPHTGMAPPESNTGGSTPPAMKTQGCLRDVIPVSVYAGGEVQFKHVGAEYSIPARFTFPGTKQTTFIDVRNKIYNELKLSQDQFSLEIQARYNAASTGSFFFTLLAISDEIAWRLIFEMAVSGMNWHIVELYVKPVPNKTCQSGNHKPTSSSDTSSITQWNFPMNTSPFQTMLFNSLVQGFWPGWPRPPPVPNQTCQNYNPTPTTLPKSSSIAQQSMPSHQIPSQNMPCNSHAQASGSRSNPISSSFPGMSSSSPQNTPMHAKPSQTKPCTSTQGLRMRSPPVPNQPNPTNLPGSSSIAMQSVPMHANPSQTVPQKSSVQGSCSGPKPNTSSFPITSTKTHQNMPTHAKTSQTKQFISTMQVSHEKSLPISNHPNLTTSLDTNNVSQQSMPMHVEPFGGIPYRLPKRFNLDGLPFTNPYPAYKGSLSVNETFESKEHFLFAINDFHITTNIEILAKKHKKNKLVLICKNQTCEWMVLATPTGVGSNWVIKECPHPHTCHAPA